MKTGGKCRVFLYYLRINISFVKTDTVHYKAVIIKIFTFDNIPHIPKRYYALNITIYAAHVII